MSPLALSEELAVRRELTQRPLTAAALSEAPVVRAELSVSEEDVAPAVPAVPGPGPYGMNILDDFNRPDEDPIAGGWGWDGSSGQPYRIVGEQMVEPATNYYGAGTWPQEFSPPCGFFFTLAAVHAEFYLEFYCGLLSQAVGYRPAYELDIYNLAGSPNWETYYVKPGSGADLLDSITGPALSDGDGVGLTYDGELLRSWYRAGAEGEWQVLTEAATVALAGASGVIQLESHAFALEDFGGGSFA